MGYEVHDAPEDVHAIISIFLSKELWSNRMEYITNLGLGPKIVTVFVPVNELPEVVALLAVAPAKVDSIDTESTLPESHVESVKLTPLDPIEEAQLQTDADDTIKFGSKNDGTLSEGWHVNTSFNGVDSSQAFKNLLSNNLGSSTERVTTRNEAYRGGLGAQVHQSKLGNPFSWTLYSTL